jgi:hypothetical protein
MIDSETTLGEEERSRRARLLRSNEELIGAARVLGALLEQRSDELGELEEAACELDEAALAYATARWELGPCRLVIGDVMSVDGTTVDVMEFAARCAALYESAEAMADLACHGGPPAAVEAARTILGNVAARFHAAGRHIVAYSITLVPGTDDDQ